MQRFSNAVRRRSRLSTTALCGLAALAALAIAGCGGGGSHTSKSGNAPNPAASKVTSRSDLITIMQADGELDDPQAAPATTIDGLTALGANVIRTIAYWNEFAPDSDSHTRPKGFDASNPGAYSASVWKTLDGADRAAAKDGVTLFVTLDGGNAPLWATGPGAQPGVNPDHWEPSAPDYGDWVKAMGLRYSGNYKPKGQSSPLPRIHFWSIWNEPNLGVEIAPVATDHGKIVSGAAQYRKLVEAGWHALAATGHTTETDTVLIGETAPRGITGAGQPAKPAEAMMPLEFIRALYCVDTNFKPLRGTQATDIGCPTTAAGTKAFATQNPALFKATGWADHPYPDGEGPTVNTQPKGTTGYTDFANLDSLATTLDKVAGVYGTKAKLPIYNTEFGYAPVPDGPYPQLSQAKAAIYLNQAEYITWSDPRIVSWDQYEWHDPGPPATFTTGLYEFKDNAPKATLNAFLMPLWLPKTSGSKGASLEVWGCARQAVGVAKASKQPQQVGIQLSTDGGKSYKTIKTVTLNPAKDGCYFDTQVKFPASGLVQTTWTNAGVPEYSRTQAITLS
jgi:hypothetical protein